MNIYNNALFLFSLFYSGVLYNNNYYTFTLLVMCRLLLLLYHNKS